MLQATKYLKLIYDQNPETRKGVNVHGPQQDNFIGTLYQKKKKN